MLTRFPYSGTKLQRQQSLAKLRSQQLSVAKRIPEGTPFSLLSGEQVTWHKPNTPEGLHISVNSASGYFVVHFDELFRSAK